MTTQRPVRRPVPLLASVACLVGTHCGQAAHADLWDAYYLNHLHYNYRVTFMTDLDQRRAGLPDNGDMYCVPTATMNLFTYAAQHGYPIGGLPPANYQSNAQHAYMTQWIDFTGDLMFTHPEDGTTCCVDLATWYLTLGSLLVHQTRYLSGNYLPGTAKMSQLGCQGWIVSFSYGKYQQVGTLSGYPIWSRYGGHEVTLSRSIRDGSYRYLTYRDPSNNSSLTTQDAAGSKVRYPFDLAGWYASAGLQTLAGIFYSNGNPRVIDSHVAIRPVFGLAFVNTGDAQGGGSIEVLDPVPFEGSEGALLPAVTISSALTVLDVIFHPDMTHGLVLAKSSILALPSRLRTLDLTTGALAIIQDSPEGLVRMDASGRNWIFAFDTDGTLFRLTAEGVADTSTTSIPQPSAVAVDDEDRAVWVLSVAERKLVKLHEDFSETLATIAIPTNVPMSGDAHLVFDPTSGIPWFRTDATPKIYGIGQAASGAPIVHVALLDGLGDLDALSISNDRLYATGDGIVKAFKPVLEGRGGPGWAPDDDSPFNGLPGGGRLAMLRSTSNYDPDIHGGPEWGNVPTAELDDDTPDVYDCVGDVNLDETVDAADLALLLGAWGTTGDLGDVNQDSTVDGADLAALLGAWGRCPR